MAFVRLGSRSEGAWTVPSRKDGGGSNWPPLPVPSPDPPFLFSVERGVGVCPKSTGPLGEVEISNFKTDNVSQSLHFLTLRKH